MKCLKNILIAAAGCLAFASCEDKLTEHPGSYYEKEEFFSNPDNAQSGVLGIYNVVGELYGINELSFFASDDLFFSQAGPADSGRRDISAYTMTTSNKCVEDVWTATYRGLERANYMIDGIENMDGYARNENLQALVAEAKFLRALLSFNLVVYWGDVPYKTTPTNTYEEGYQPRSDREDIYDQIVQDLTDAEEGLEWATAESSPERATQGAARALKMRVLLQRAGYSLRMDGTLKRPEDAVRRECFEAVIEEWKAFEANGYHGFFDSSVDGATGYEGLFRSFSAGVLDSKESLFELAFYTLDGSRGVRGVWGTYIGPVVAAPGISNSETDQFMGRAQGFFRVIPEWKGFFEEGDSRRDVMICTYRYDWDAEAYNHVKVDVERNVRNWYPGKWRREWMPLGYKDMNYTDVNFCLLRYADVVLMAAEAYNETGDTSKAWELLNSVRERAGASRITSGNYDELMKSPKVWNLDYIDDSDEQGRFRTALYWERSFELAFEGQRKYDLIRWGVLAQALKQTGNLTEANTAGSTKAFLAGDNFQTGKNELFPIPLDEIQANPKLENKNNPNY